MRVKIELSGRHFFADLSAGIDLSWPVTFDGRSSLAFGLPPARARAFEAGGHALDVRRGGSVNCELLELLPHGSGTHTECVGHLLEERVTLAQIAPPPLMLALLLSAEPVPFSEANEPYEGKRQDDDLVVSGAKLRESFERLGRDRLDVQPEALVIRAFQGLPPASFSGTNPPYLTGAALDFALSLEVRHLLVDLPSLDREDDGGALCAHRRFFGLERGARTLGKMPVPQKTVTELCRIPEEVADGIYLLSLQVPPLSSDAAPSRVVVFPLTEVS